jgi:REP element-mobilizing transposase RayT
LKGFDYSQAGAYFVTICIQNRICLFGKIENGEIQLTEAGYMVHRIWNELPEKYPGVEIDEFIVMPNHIHGIVVLNVGAGPCACPDSNKGQPRGVAPTRLSLPDVVHRYKSFTTSEYRIGVEQLKWIPFPGKLWQRNYYEHVIRNEKELNQIREYISNNPLQWALDNENPQNMK